MLKKPLLAWSHVIWFKSRGAPCPQSKNFSNEVFGTKKAQNCKNKVTFKLKTFLSLYSKSGLIFIIFQVFPAEMDTCNHAPAVTHYRAWQRPVIPGNATLWPRRFGVLVSTGRENSEMPIAYKYYVNKRAKREKLSQEYSRRIATTTKPHLATQAFRDSTK